MLQIMHAVEKGRPYCDQALEPKTLAEVPKMSWSEMDSCALWNPAVLYLQGNCSKLGTPLPAKHMPRFHI